MNKLIKLPDGPYIRANQIIQIGEPFQDMGQWCYSIGYKSEIHNDVVLSHLVRFSVILQNEERAFEKVRLFVDRINGLCYYDGIENRI